MGRIVYYTPGDPTAVDSPQAPAIVSRVGKPEGDAPANLDLTVFPPGLPPYSVSNVPESTSGGSEPATWCWPPAAPTGSAPEGSTDAPADGDGEAASTGDGSSNAPPAAEGDAAGSGDGGEQSGGDAPTTSAASEKPLYKIAGDEVPDGFTESGLETPEGAELYHYSNDTAGQPHTFDVGSVEGIVLYAEADDNEQPVQAATAAA